MQNELLLSFIIFTVTATITPGPNNITSAAAGVKIGYRRTVPYISGISLGVFIILIIAGFFTSSLNTESLFFTILTWSGAFYIVLLGLAPFIFRNKNKNNKEITYTFITGMILQLLNIKLIFFGLTIFTSFSEVISVSALSVILTALFGSGLAFACISLWTLAGSTLSKYFENRTFYIIFNGVIAVIMILIALSILLGH